MYLHKTKNENYTPPCCYFSGELEVVEILRSGLCGKSSFLSNLVGLYSRTIIVTRAPGAEIEIGNNVGISGATIYARKKITIGENTCIGGNCKILDNDFHPIEAETRNKLLRDENGGDSDLVPSREIEIGKNCFIGCNSIVLKGILIHWMMCRLNLKN